MTWCTDTRYSIVPSTRMVSRAPVGGHDNAARPTAGVPFLSHLLSRIQAAGVRRVILGTSYLAETFATAFGDGDEPRLALVYVVEDNFDKQAPAGAFIEVKRLARVDLSGKEVEARIRPAKDVGLLRPETIGKPPEESTQPDQRSQAQPPPQPQPEQAGALQFASAVGAAALPVPLKMPGGASSGNLVQVPGGLAAFEGGKVKNAQIDNTSRQDQC